jgi:hypothetical protein
MGAPPFPLAYANGSATSTIMGKAALPTARAGFYNSYGVAAGGWRRVTKAVCSGLARPC